MGYALSYGAAGAAAALQGIEKQRRDEESLTRALADKRLEQISSEQARVQSEREFKERQRTNDSLIAERAAQAAKNDAAIKRAEDRANGLSELVGDPAKLSGLTPLARLLTLGQLGVANVGVHDVETPDEHGRHTGADKDAKFAEWQKQYDYERTHPKREPVDPAVRLAGRLSMDDPSFPRGVQSYVTQLRAKYPDATGAQEEFARALPSLLQAHPSMSPLKVQNAVRQQYGGSGRASGDDLLNELLGGGVPEAGGPATTRNPSGSPAPVRIRGARVVTPGAPSVRGAGDPGLDSQARTVIRQRLGRDASNEEVSRFLANPQNRARLAGGG